MPRDPFNHTWIEEGKILAGSIPTSGADIETLRSMGIRTILSLTRRSLWDCPDISRAIGDIVVSECPIPDTLTPTDDILDKAMRVIAGSEALRLPIYVHCRGGIGRTGLILQIYYFRERKLAIPEIKALVGKRRNYQGNASAIDQGSPEKEYIDDHLR